MKVKLTTRYASKLGNFGPGAIIDVDAPEGAGLVSGGYAEVVEDAKAPVIETATAVPKKETAKAAPKRKPVARKPRKRVAKK